ncbi:MAG: hypothetical protein QM681_08905 [Novosphingobium sp.]
MKLKAELFHTFGIQRFGDAIYSMPPNSNTTRQIRLMITEHTSIRPPQIVAAADAGYKPSDANPSGQWATRVMQAYRASLVNVHRQLVTLRN